MDDITHSSIMENLNLPHHGKKSRHVQHLEEVDLNGLNVSEATINLYSTKLSAAVNGPNATEVMIAN